MTKHPTAAPVAVVLLLATGLAWIEHGSIDRGDWLPYSFAVGIFLAAVLTARTASRVTPAALLSLAALAGLACWDAISLAWAPSPSLGRDEALLVLSGACAFAVAASTVIGRRDRRAVSVLLATFSSLTALSTSVVTLLANDPLDLYRSGRLEAPIGYTNALAAVFLIGFWPAIALAAEPSSRRLVRAAATAGAAAMLAGELQAQSKGAGLGLVLGGAILLAISPRRLRLLLPAGLVATTVWLAWGRLTEPFRLQQAAHALEEASIREAAVALLVVAAVAGGAGLLYAALDVRVKVSDRATRLLNVGAGSSLLLAVGIAATWLAVSSGEVDRWGSQRWADFTDSAGQQLDASSNFGSFGSSRYDSWRVAVHQFASEPILGNGARSFRAAYLEQGRTPDTPERSHSLELDVLSETGVVGFGLLLAALVPSLLLMARRARRSLAEGALFAAAAAWLVHASVDWIWTMPALLLPFLALLGAGASADDRRPIGGRASLVAAVAAVIGSIALFMPPWLSSRFTEQAYGGGSGARAIEWAKRLDPLALEPYLAEAQLASSPEGSITALREAVRKEPQSAALHYFLGTQLARAGRRREALRQLTIARDLYPRNPEILAAVRRVRDQG